MKNMETMIKDIIEQLYSSRRNTPFIAIEGTNGVGKTTVCRLLSETLQCNYNKGVPAEYEKNHELKAKILSSDTNYIASILFFLSGLIEQSDNFQKVPTAMPIITDRWLWSTLAVHYAYDKNNLRISKLNEIIKAVKHSILMPDLTFILYAEIDAINNRISKKEQSEQSFDLLTLNCDFLSREQEFYFLLNEILQKNTTNSSVVIDTENKTAIDVSLKIQNHINLFMEQNL
jgi:thymidylate kinase